MIQDIDAAMRRSLRSLAAELSLGTWKGQREREVVSLFCFGHLLPAFAPGTALHDPTQLGIEVAVPQNPNHRGRAAKARKLQVCKDIVIWPRPRMYVWDKDGKPTVVPLSVIEWKHNVGGISRYDLQWLQSFSGGRANFVGYSVSTNRPGRGFILSCTRVALGRRKDRWIHVT